MNTFSVYAPQAGGIDEEKEQFWAALQELEEVDENERCIFGGDMNGHVGSGNEAISRIHGGNAYGNGDEDGEKVIDLALSFDMVIGNTLFRKRNEHLITYKSGNRASQIDFLLYRRRNIREIKNCKVKPGDHVTEQHRLFIIDLNIDVTQKQKRRTTTQRRIKWFKLKENDSQQEFKDRILRELSHDMEDVNSWWNGANSIILRAGKEILGESSGRVWEDKEIWWFK
ncbi:craniofacial development protein 2-like [Penaeus monodon]|uniref:craniofacial development protein 2-like n=1 Tax=Penaeus monodon TaxID=6687 RepID=UPI0018A6E313|nr:craniofacial development protein 2-like [Penaeus monodon]